MLTRLADRIETDTEGKETKIIRYGMWGTNLEIEGRAGKYFVIFPSGKQQSFPRLADAEIFLKESTK